MLDIKDIRLNTEEYKPAIKPTNKAILKLIIS